FKGGLEAIRRVARELSVPVVVKETGNGFSAATLRHLRGTGIAAVDVAGRGGTHWGRIEGYRLSSDHPLYAVAQTFSDWGISTLESLLYARELDLDYEIWASGGVRSGLDSAKVMALGARMVGLAQPWLEAVLSAGDPQQNLDRLLNRMEYELKVSCFCTGSRTPLELAQGGKWKWRKTLN
ncbi:MAG: alpha-hydroxy-acid oxidizing protein, partial [Bdellovibrionaceae bacterium]|nr:alpha-hydroxy-acid oxidizing protein [Pseudobdellovibrionaceae bacterium]